MTSAYPVRPLETCFALLGNFRAQINDDTQEIFVSPKVFDLICQQAVTSVPNSLHLLSLVERYPSHVASCLGWTPEEALAAAGKLREDMIAHGLDVPASPPSFARGANPPPSIPEP